MPVELSNRYVVVLAAYCMRKQQVMHFFYFSACTMAGDEVSFRQIGIARWMLRVFMIQTMLRIVA